MIDFNVSPGPLFCPGDHHARIEKASSLADVVIVDLEDGVGPDKKDLARDNVTKLALDPSRVVVRINAPGTPEHAADLRALRATDFTTIMLPKAESREAVESVNGFDVIAIVETVGGVISAREVASAANVVAMVWGAEDLVASMGGFSSRFEDGRYRDFARFARSEVLFAARAHDVVAWDAVYMNIPDLDGLEAEALDAAASGFGGKVCIHPSQVPVVRRAFMPTADQVERASRVLAAAAASDAGVFSLEGQMIDEPLLIQARQLVNRAEALAGNPL